jgi:hypothetical protein
MDHDHSYKLLFSHPEMVADLLRGFVREDWVEQLDFATLEKQPNSYVSDDLRERADDVVWRLRFADAWLYVYLLIEFQSSVDPFMAVRVMTYLGLLYQDLIRSGQQGADGRLPPVLPLVLYNGKPRWSAALNVADLIQPAPGSLSRYTPRLEYLLLDEGRYAESELQPLRNLAAALFRLENSRTPHTMDAVLAALTEWLAAPSQASLRRAFVVWIRQGLQSKLPGIEFPQLNELYEVRSMLADRVEEWFETWKQEGLEEGRQEGITQGESAMLLELMELRFSTLEESVRQRIAAADAKTLLRWGKRIFQAATAEEVVRD